MRLPHEVQKDNAANRLIRLGNKEQTSPRHDHKKEIMLKAIDWFEIATNSA